MNRYGITPDVVEDLTVAAILLDRIVDGLPDQPTVELTTASLVRVLAAAAEGHRMHAELANRILEGDPL